MIIRNNINNLSIDNSVGKIVDFTANTWQSDRTLSEKKSDTNLGKLAEEVLEDFFRAHLPNIEYLSYDTFRSNNYEKHAPFDGIVYSKNISAEVLSVFIVKINNEVTNNQWGKISNSLKLDLEKNLIYTVEVKSTRVAERHKRNGIDTDSIKKSILQDDFLEYPTRLRTVKFGTMNTLEDYIKFCEKVEVISCPSGSDKNQIIRDFEQVNMRYFYFRVYIDESLNKAYIVGYIDKFVFSSLFVWKKMKKINKSEHALYLAVPFTHAISASLFTI
jgi:hypothetical protein